MRPPGSPAERLRLLPQQSPARFGGLSEESSLKKSPEVWAVVVREIPLTLGLGPLLVAVPVPALQSPLLRTGT